MGWVKRGGAISLYLDWLVHQVCLHTWRWSKAADVGQDGAAGICGMGLRRHVGGVCRFAGPGTVRAHILRKGTHIVVEGTSRRGTTYIKHE